MLGDQIFVPAKKRVEDQIWDRGQGCSTLYSLASGLGESEMPHTDSKRPVIVESGFPRRGAV